MKRRWIWYAHIYYDVIRQLKDKNRVVNSSVLKTTIVGGRKSEAESLPTYKRVKFLIFTDCKLDVWHGRDTREIKETNTVTSK